MGTLLLFTTIAASLALVFFLIKPRDQRQKNYRSILAALERLKKRPYGAYLIIEEPAVGKFVQFSGSVSEPLTFDLARQSLTLAEFEKAEQLFDELSLPGPETFTVFEHPGQPAVETQTSFLVLFDGDLQRAAALTMEVFEKIYAVKSSVTLSLTER